MGSMTVRNIPDEIHEELKERASKNNRSAEAEVRALIAEAIVSSASGGFGSRLRERFSDILGDELDVSRDKTPAEPAQIG